MIHDCPNCAALRERAVWLESELGIQRAATADDRLRDWMLSVQKNGNNVSRSQASRLVGVLYRANGRAVSRWQILDAIPPKHGGDDDRNAKLVAVWVCFARRALGRDAIKNVWGVGYRLTDIGMEKVARIMGVAGVLAVAA